MCVCSGMHMYMHTQLILFHVGKTQTGQEGRASLGAAWTNVSVVLLSSSDWNAPLCVSAKRS